MTRSPRTPRPTNLARLTRSLAALALMVLAIGAAAVVPYLLMIALGVVLLHSIFGPLAKKTALRLYMPHSTDRDIEDEPESSGGRALRFIGGLFFEQPGFVPPCPVLCRSLVDATLSLGVLSALVVSVFKPEWLWIGFLIGCLAFVPFAAIWPAQLEPDDPTRATPHP